MNSTLLSLFIVFLLTIQTQAQSPRKLLREANRHIEVEHFNNAIEKLAPLVEENHPEATLLTGFSMMSLEEDMSSAIEMLQKAAELYPLKQENSETTIEAHFYLAQAYRINEDTEKAIEKFEQLKNHTSDTEVLEEIEREITYCHNLQKLKKEPVEMNVEHMGEIINSPYEDHSPIALYDESTIYFTSNRPVDSLDVERPLFENIFVTNWRNGQWTEPVLLEIPGYSQANRATVGLTPEGQGLIFYQNDGLSGSLFISERSFDGWTEPEPLPAPINSNYDETHASFSPDGNTIFFSSNRPKGLGGKDIYYSKKLPDGSWGKPINLGETINTTMDEEGPFIHPDNKTLYFSSSGHNSMGGYDIFKSKKDENGEWSKPQNAGYPINTANDDVFYIPTPNGQRVYYASRREGSIGQTDLFVLHFPAVDDRSLAVVSSHVFTSEKQPAETAIIRVTNKTTNEQIGTYRTNPSSGKFVAIVPTAQEYELHIDADGHESYSQSFGLNMKDDFKSKNRAVYLPSITLEKTETPE